MKIITSTFISISILILVSLIAYSCENKNDITNTGGDDKIENAKNKSDSLAPCITNCLMSLPYEDVSPEEEAHLVMMREEEILAQEVYEYLYTLYSIPVFNNISKSENVHTLTIKVLLDKYGIDDPAAGHQTGIFQNQELQELYNTLTALGNQSFLDALIVGETIEDLDIFDLQLCLEDVDNIDIELVFSNLCKGSRNHLRAFYGHLSNQGHTYTPQYISQEYYDEIVNSSWETGNGICMYCAGIRTTEDISHE